MYPPFPPSFQLGPLTIHWYGITMVTAIFVCALLASRYVARRGQDSNHIWNMLLWVVIPAIIGARLYYVFIQSPRGPDGLDSYLAHPIEIVEIWRGGIHIYGALIGGGIALLIYVYVKKLPALIYLDAVARGLLLSQAIGRLGNFMNQELYGPPTTLPWGLRIDPANRLAPYNNLALYPESTRFQPLFLYEMILNLIGFALIFWLARRFEKKLRDGDIVLMYLIWYPLVRFFLEFFRTDSWFFPGTPFNLVHLLSAIVVIASTTLLIIRHWNRPGRSIEVVPQVGSVALSEEEEEAEQGSGIDMSEEYTFLRKNRQNGAEARAEDTKELVEDEMLEDELGEEESEGVEDIEDWDGESPEEEMVFEEGEEYAEEENKVEGSKKAILKGKEEKEEPEELEEEEEEPEEEEEEEEPEEEENEEEEPEVEEAEESGEAEEEESTAGVAGENEEGVAEEEGGAESAASEDEAEESGEESVVGEDESEDGNADGSEDESAAGEDEADDEAESAEEGSEGTDEGDADASSDE